MRAGLIWALAAGLSLAGCDRHEDAAGLSSKAKGRYAGIGTYEPSGLWAENTGAKPPVDTAAAKLEDDDQIIVLVDSHTGEVRQCGNHSGFCITMNPWEANSPRVSAPVKLTKHASELDSQSGEGADEAEPAANVTTRSH